EGFDSQNRIAISDNATGILKGGQNSIYIYDFTNDTVLTKFSRGWDIRNYKISPEGNYFFLTASQLKIYKYTQDTVITTWDNPLDLKYKFYKFDAATPKQYVLWDGDKFVVRRCSDNSTVYSFNLSHDKLLNIDYYNNKILTMNGRRLFVLDYHSGEVEETIPVSSTDKNYKIIDSHIIREDGFIHFLNSN
ncbi:MAG TPA: hypothetical protein VJ876_01740, partial [Bacteroidales bacterium]|nr:hypothetical protein [Bacteroidales bacterium]